MEFTKMRKSLLLIISYVFLSFGFANAQGTVTILGGNFNADSVGFSFTVPIEVTGITSQDLITGYSFDISYPNGLQLENVEVTNTITPSTGANSYQTALNKTFAQQVRFAAAGGQNQITLPQGQTSGILANLIFKVNSSVTNGQIEFTEFNANTTPNGFVFNSGSVPTTLVNGTIDVTLVGIEDENNSLPTSFSLNQNFPNPFNPSTTIQFALPVSEFVSLKIYNLLGQEVNQLVDENFNAGFHNVKWNGLDKNNNPVSSGVYLYKIEAGSFVSIKKAVYLK
ncbi:MAG: T9SS C-terminal target domain-containing protein [Calditrichaeota bacterium]|nr:MAG: T9SS C-terminal target domain-containing protein [Calditrichota bacterium]